MIFGDSRNVAKDSFNELFFLDFGGFDAPPLRVFKIFLSTQSFTCRPMGSWSVSALLIA